MHAADHITKERSTTGGERRNSAVRTKTSVVDNSMHRPLGNLGMLSQAGGEVTPVQLKCGACGDFEKEKQLQLKALPGERAVVQEEEGKKEEGMRDEGKRDGEKKVDGKSAELKSVALKSAGAKSAESKSPESKSAESKSPESKSVESKSGGAKSVEQGNGEAAKSASKRSSVAVMRKCKTCEDEESVQTKPVVQREEGQEELLQGKRSTAPASGTNGASSSKSASEGKGKSDKPSAQSATAAHATTVAAPASTPLHDARVSTFIARRVQRKVVVGDADDEYEREADRVADAVLSATSAPYTHATPSIRPVTGSLGGGGVQGMMDDDAPGAAPGGAGSRFESRLAGSRGGGGMLPTETRLAMERGFGYDFSSVRIHTGNEADVLNRDVHARAFTSGLDIYFASGEYNPTSTEGRRLLAHELTHVVQQAGGSGGETGVQRASYGDCPPLRGTPLGKRFEEHLRDANPMTLITQGRVPGGITNVTELDKVGKPDLYMSTPALTIPGMKGKPIVKKTPDADDFEEMDRGGAKAGKAISFSPTKSGGTWSGAFPQVHVGDIKPLSIYKAGEVRQQLSNYISGYTDFLASATSVFPGLTAPTTPGTRMSSITIPPGYDYDQFIAEVSKPSPSTPNLITGNKRYWLVFDNTEGIIYYFCLTNPYRPGTSSRELTETFDALLPLKRSLRQRNASFTQPVPVRKKSMPSAPVAAAPLQEVRASGEGAARVAQAQGDLTQGDLTQGGFAKEERADGAMSASARRKLVQRAVVDPKIQLKRTKIDWGAKRKEWEKMRTDWDTGHGKKYLKNKSNKAYLEKLEVDKELSSKGFNVKPVKESKEDVKKLKTVELWSGRSGEQLIFWRAKLGGAFDLVADFLDRMREKFAGLKDKLNKKLGKMNVSKFEGWKKKFLSILTEAAKIAFVQLLDALKDIFVNCMESVADKILEGIGEEVEGIDIVQDVKGIYENVEKFAKDVEKEFHDRFAEYDTLIETLTDIKRWIGIIADLVTVARGIWQAISCLSPPAIGCLWGLAGQFAFSAVLSLMMEIQEFRNAISGMVLGLFKNYVGDRFKSLMMWGLEQVGLAKFADPAKCSPAQSGGGSGDDLGLIASPFSGGAASQDDMLKELRKWEEENKDLLLRETLEGLKGTKGITLTSQQLLELLKALKDSGWTREEIEKNFGGSGSPATFDEIMAKLKKAKDPQQPEGEKKEEEKKQTPQQEQTPQTTTPQPADQQPPPATAPQPSGGGEPANEKDKTATPGPSVPVLDATKAGAGTDSGNRTGKYASLVSARSDHTAHPNNPPIMVTVWVYEFPEDGGKAQHILTLTNVEVIVVKRTWDPTGSNENTATRLKVHYKLVKPVPLDPILSGVTLVGDDKSTIHGYIKWR